MHSSHQAKSYIKEMAELSRRVQTIIVHNHGQSHAGHGRGHQYSPIAAATTYHDLQQHAKESYRMLIGGGDIFGVFDKTDTIPVACRPLV